MSENKKQYLNLGTVTKRKPKTDNPDEPKAFYIKMEQQKKKDGTPVGPQIYPIRLANGVVINDGDVLSMYSKKEKLKALVEDGKITQDTADKLASFLMYDVVLTVHGDDKKSDDGVNF